MEALKFWEPVTLKTLKVWGHVVPHLKAPICQYSDFGGKECSRTLKVCEAFLKSLNSQQKWDFVEFQTQTAKINLKEK